MRPLQKILITGGAGYIGSVLSGRLLREGYAVRVFDNLSFGGESLLPLCAHGQFSFVRGDVRDAKSVAAAIEGTDCVIHLAAIVGDPACKLQPELAQAINYGATCNLARLSKEHGVRRLIFFSTCSNYGMSDTSHMATEDSLLNPLSLYAQTKVESEQFIRKLAGDGFEPCILRLSTVFGLSPRMRFDLTVNEFTRDAVVRAKIVMYGEQFWRPYIHTTDIAEAVVLCLSAPAKTVSGETFNVGDDSFNVQKRRLVEMIQKHVPDVTVERVAQATDPRDYRVSFAKIRERLGFLPKRTVEDGIREIRDALREGIIMDPDGTRYRNSR